MARFDNPPIDPPIPLDSREGMEMLARAARASSFVLNEYHEQLAAKYGVSLEGITISRPLPVHRRRFKP